MSSKVAKKRAVPPLENGDHLTAAEFRRRYEAMPESVRAQLIDGVVYMSSPVRFNGHAERSVHLATLFGIYAAFTPGVRTGGDATVRLADDSEPQPDLLMLIDPHCGGQCRITDDDYLAGAPELVAEVANSSVSMDLNTKYRAYQASAALEYLVWRVTDDAIDWFALEDGVYSRVSPDADGTHKSAVFSGLWLDAPALLRGEMATVFATLTRGLASPEHTAFVAKLAAAKKPE